MFRTSPGQKDRLSWADQARRGLQKQNRLLRIGHGEFIPVLTVIDAEGQYVRWSQGSEKPPDGPAFHTDLETTEEISLQDPCLVRPVVTGHPPVDPPPGRQNE